jgi:hypothetical protein
MLRYDCLPTHLGDLRVSLAPRYLVCSPRSCSPLRARRLMAAPRRRQDFGSPGPPLRGAPKEGEGSPTFPRSPSADLPRSPTPGVSNTRAKARRDRRPAGACPPSAAHHSPRCGAPSRGLAPRYPRLQPSPYNDARGFATDRLVRLASGGIGAVLPRTHWGTSTNCMGFYTHSQGFGLTLARARHN